MIERLKKIGNVSLGIVFVIGVAALPLLFLKGAVWASRTLLGPLILIGVIAVVFDILILLPLSLFRALRPHTGGLIYLSSYLFGLVTWLYGFVVTYILWGGFAVVIGLMFFGVGVVFMAVLASLFKALWGSLLTILVLAVVTYGSRLAGYAIGNSQPASRDVEMRV
jgi:hypothetical protein